MNVSSSKRRRASVVCVHRDALLLVKLRDPETKILRLFPPGGAIEINETPEDAALRECLEETNCTVKLDTNSRLDDFYDFVWNGQTFHCHTTYFSANLVHQDTSEIRDASYNEGVVWLPLTDVELALEYDDRILNSVLKLISLDI